MQVQNSLFHFIHQVSIGRLFIVQTFTYVKLQFIALVLVTQYVLKDTFKKKITKIVKTVLSVVGGGE